MGLQRPGVEAPRASEVVPEMGKENDKGAVAGRDGPGRDNLQGGAPEGGCSAGGSSGRRRSLKRHRWCAAGRAPA